MTETDTSSSPRPKALLEGLLAAWEDEALECKQAEKSFDTDKLGKYFSPLSNEAALRGIQNAWMLLGIDVRSHRIVGTSAFPLPGQRNNLKQTIAEHNSTKGKSRDIHGVRHSEGRVLMLEFPAGCHMEGSRLQPFRREPRCAPARHARRAARPRPPPYLDRSDATITYLNPAYHGPRPRRTHKSPRWLPASTQSLEK